MGSDDDVRRSIGDATTRGDHNILATRKPMLPLRELGSLLLRSAERTSTAPLNQEPPRRTRQHRKTLLFRRGLGARRTKRWACVVSHARAGKTIACLMDLVDAALRCNLPEPRFAYVAPYYAQAKDIAWT